MRGDAADLVHDLADRQTALRAEIERPELAAVAQVIQRAHMRIGKVGDMDVVAHGRAVRRRIVGAEDFQRRRDAERRLDRQRNEMGFRIVVLADLAIGIGARGVEVPQRDPLQPVRVAEPRQHPLGLELAFAVRVDRVCRRAFGDRHLGRCSVHGACRGEHQLGDAGLRHHFQEIDGAGDVVAEIPGGVFDQLADIGECGKMQDGFDLDSDRSPDEAPACS